MTNLKAESKTSKNFKKIVMCRRKRAYLIIFLMIICYLPGHALAKVKGLCSNCHTMHASQTPWPSGWASDIEGNPVKRLLANTCVGCHSHDSVTTYELGSGAGACTVPVVNTTGSAPTEYLAGGNFYWVATGDDSRGHNVLGIAGTDVLGEAPGNPYTCTGSCHMSLATALPAHLQGSDYGYGANGCTGCHLCPKHHANDHENTVSGLVDSADKGWYRFLSGHMSGNTHGVEGYEDGDWEMGQPNLAVGQINNHNEYLGYEGNIHDGGHHFNRAGFYNLGNTMTAFCCGCHGDFHVQNPVTMSCDPTGTTLRDWTRHPSDAVIPNESEYADTGGAAHFYDPLSPVASPTVDGTPDGTVAPGLDFVMCLSCHRPHGTPYSDLLRWDYGQMVAGPSTPTADIGCFYCHTTKND